jgi:hypothetical protein
VVEDQIYAELEEGKKGAGEDGGHGVSGLPVDTRTSLNGMRGLGVVRLYC